MRVTFFPSKGKGTIEAPPSKSIAHRALICSALTSGCTMTKCGISQDVVATVNCLEVLGAWVHRDGEQVRVGGLMPMDIPHDVVLDCGESGSTLRFLLPLCLLSGQQVTLRCGDRLSQRPMSVYADICREQGLYYQQAGDVIRVKGPLKSGYYHLPGDVSSQFVTGLLFALSLLNGESRIEICGRLESAPYIDITLAVLSDFGISVKREENTFIVAGNDQFVCDNYVVEGDCSNAAYMDALNALGGSVKVLNLSPGTPQGDRVYANMFADISMGKKQFDLTDCPDLGPIMFVLAAVFGGAEFTGTARLRLKESDRCESMALELKKFGIDVDVLENAVHIHAGDLKTPLMDVCGHNDHRVIMAMSILCSITGGTVSGAEFVAKSYPKFFDELQFLGIKLSISD